VTDDETGIADAILNVMRDPDGAADQADEGRRVVLREYDWGPLAGKLEEIWTVFNPKDTHGVTNDLTKDELNDLIEYLRTL